MQYGVQKGPFIYNLDLEDVKEVTNMVDTEQQLDISHLTSEATLKEMEVMKVIIKLSLWLLYQNLIKQ